jgi:hypothetical protein
MALIAFVISCKSKQPEKPVLLNPSTIVSVPAEKFLFKSTHKNWKASLLSFTQPIPVLLDTNSNGFSLSLQHSYGVTEGPAQIVLSYNKQFFYYDVTLHNNSFGVITERDYRFPKTVNPDSSLKQQRMLHRIDEWRNIINAPHQTKHFYEDIIQLNPIAGNYRAQKSKPISAFYIQPGSAVAIPVQSIYSKANDEFIVTAGPLKDANSNTVANGTLVAFLYTDGEKNYRTEAALLNGMAIVHLPAKQKSFLLKANIHTTYSNTIQLKP